MVRPFVRTGEGIEDMIDSRRSYCFDIVLAAFCRMLIPVPLTGDPALFVTSPLPLPVVPFSTPPPLLLLAE